MLDIINSLINLVMDRCGNLVLQVPYKWEVYENVNSSFEYIRNITGCKGVLLAYLSYMNNLISTG
jgi:hypothetical protein